MIPLVPRTSALTLLTLLAVLAMAPPALALTGGPDGYGYTFIDSNSGGGPVYQWIDITSTGTAIVTDGDDTSTFDPTVGNNGPVELGFPFTFYGVTHTSMTAAANGFLSTINDKGADATNDCPVPETPSEGGGARLYPLHDDLTLVGGGDIYYQYFHASPHPHSLCGVSIFTWDQAIEKGTGSNVTFQALLFDNGDILFQYQPNSVTSAGGLTVGIQNEAANIGLAHSCSDTGSLAVPSNIAILFEPPTLTVTTNADEFDDPATMGSGLVSLREAIRDVVAGGKITFAPGLSGLTLDITTGDPATLLTADRTMAIDGSSLAAPFQISGGRAERIMEITGSGVTVTLQNLVIRDGAATQSHPAGIELFGGTRLKCCGVDFLFNKPGPSVVNGYGAIRTTSSGRLDAVRCRFRGNAATRGGAIDYSTTSAGRCEIRHCEFACNRSDSRGGAIAYSGLSLFSVFDSSFFDNEAADSGSAIRVQGGNFSVRECTFSHNRCGTLSGAINLTSAISSAAITHCTIVDNESGFGAAGIAYSGAAGPGISIGHTVLANNRRADGTLDNLALPAGATSLGYNLVDNAEIILNQPTDLINTDPLLGPLGPYGGNFTMTRLPLAGSPLIDAGSPTPPPSAIPTDQRGLPRIADGDNSGVAMIDIGAVEAGSFITVDTTTDENNTPATSGSGFISLREAVRDAASGQHIRFDPSLSGSEFTLNFGGGTPLSNAGADSFHLDASNLTDRPRLRGFFDRTLTTTTGQTASLHHIRTVNGVGTNGGAIAVSGPITIDRCHLEGAQATHAGGGGAIWCNATHAAIHKSVFRENRCQAVGADGSAVRIISPAYLRVTGSWFHLNRNVNSRYTLVTEGSLLIDGCTFSRNRDTSIDSGCVKKDGDGCLIVRSSTFSQNVGRFYAPALSVSGYSFPAGVSHSTFFGNLSKSTGTSDGGAITNAGSTSPIDLSFNLFARNIVSNEVQNLDASPSSYRSEGYNLADENDPALDDPTDLNVLDPLVAQDEFQLGPLAWNGGCVPVHHPLIGSPAIDGDGFTPVSSNLAPVFDARGFARFQDGDLDSTIRIDVGAVEAVAPIFVTTPVDENNGAGSGAGTSLREAIAAAPDPGRILFLPGLAGSTIDLDSAASGQNTPLNVDKTLIIDAFNLFNRGITLAGPSASRIMNFSLGDDDLALHGVSFTDGKGSSGGAINVQNNRLTITHAALHNNNPSGGGGALLVNNSEILMENVTLAENTALGGGVAGGAISASNGTELIFRHCTIVDNEATAAGAGLLLSGGDTSATFYATIFAENFLTGGSLSNFFRVSFPQLHSEGYNLTDEDGTWFDQATDIINTAPVLNGLPAPISHPGGLAITLPPGAGSPAVNTGPPPNSAPPCTDARGFPRLACGPMDIGAYELGGSVGGAPGNDFFDGDGLDNYWEAFYGFSLITNDANVDTDGDGRTNLEEFLAQTKPKDADSALRIKTFSYNSQFGFIALVWNASPGLTYGIYHSEDLDLTDPWTKIGFFTPYSTSGIFNITDPAFLALPAAFFEVRVE